jgi:hypothetical protein
VVTCSLREIENMSKGHLGDGLWSVTRNIRDGNTPFRCGLAIYDVHSRGGDANILQVRQILDSFPRDDGLIGDNDLGSGASFPYLLGLGTFVNLQFAELSEIIPREISRIEGVTVKD